MIKGEFYIFISAQPGYYVDGNVSKQVSRDLPRGLEPLPAVTLRTTTSTRRRAVLLVTMLGFFDAIVLLVSLAISLAILVPLSGVLVRFRANYNPKALQLDTEGHVQAYTSPVITSYFAMLKRVYDIEVSLFPGFTYLHVLTNIGLPRLVQGS